MNLDDKSRVPIFMQALSVAIRRPSLWLLCWSVPLAAACVIALPWVSWFEGTLEHAYEPGALMSSMSEVFRFDHQGDLAALRTNDAQVGAVLAFLLMLFGVYAAGGWLQVFLDRHSGQTLKRFFWGGAKFFWRFVRVWLCTLLVLALTTWIFHGWVWNTVVSDVLFGAEGGNTETLDSETAVLWLERTRSALYGISVALVLAWAAYTRSRLAVHGTRSAIWAGLATLFLMICHPVRTLRPLAFLLAVEAGVVFTLGRLSWSLNLAIDAETQRLSLLWLFLISNVALLWQTISRAARYAATIHVSRRLIAPIAKPDPWSDRIGGPGGPQYPIDDSDDYNISI